MKRSVGMECVVVPEGVASGERMRVALASGGEVELSVPEGVSPGDLLHFHPPSPAPSSMQVLVPEGAVAGGELSVVAEDGSVLVVRVPDGVTPGETLEVELPLPSPERSGQVDEPWKDSSCDEPSEAAPLESGKGVAWNASEPSGESSKYVAGERCVCQRASGEYTPCIIVEYDHASETYTVEIEVPPDSVASHARLLHPESQLALSSHREPTGLAAGFSSTEWKSLTSLRFTTRSRMQEHTSWGDEYRRERAKKQTLTPSEP